MKKISKQRLVKFLEKKTPDEISKIVREKNLGEALGVNRRIQSLAKGGQEGALELVGDPRASAGISVRKLYDVEESPVASIGSVASKIRKQKILNKDPRTKDLFTQHIPGSFKVSPNKKVVSTNSEYVPKALSDAKRQTTAIKAHRESQKVLGEKLYDILPNEGNVRTKVVDFVDVNSTITHPELSVLIKNNPGKKVSDRLKRGLRSHPKTKPGMATMEHPYFSGNPKKTDIEIGKRNPFGKGVKTQKKSLEEQGDYKKAKKAQNRETIISNLKKKFYEK